MEYSRSSMVALSIISIILVSGLASGIVFIPPAKASPRSTSPTSSPIPSAAVFNYLVVIMMENKNVNDIIGNSSAPYETSLATAYAYATNYRFVSHYGSQPNYQAMISGDPEDGTVTTSTWGRCNSTPAACTAWPSGGSGDPTLVQRIELAGISWKAYMDLMPQNCYQSDSPSSTAPEAYEPHHDPFVWYSFAQPGTTDCGKVVPAGTNAANLISDLNSASAPNFMWLSPDSCHDMENCPVSTGDSWLSRVIPNILNSNTFTHQKAALFLIWDEQNKTGDGGLVPAIWAGPAVKTGYVQTTPNVYNHYSLTRTVEVEWGLSCIVSSTDCAAPPMTEFFNELPDFSISASSPSVVIAGQSATSTITVSPVNGFTGTVTLSDTVPNGLTCSSISPGSISGGSGTATLSCNSSSAGSYNVNITGTSSSGTHTTAATFTFTAPGDFSISASPSPVTVSPGSPGTSVIGITLQNGFGGIVGLSANNPACALSPSSVTGSGSSTLSCTFTSGGTIPVAVTGTSGSLSHSTTVTYIVQDFTMTAAPTPVIVNASSQGTSTITVTAVNGFTGTVALSPSSCSLSQVSVTLTSTSTTGSAALTCTFSSAGTNSVTVTGSLGSLSHTATASFQVTDFTVTASPTSVTVNKSSPGTSTITVTPVNGYTGTITLTKSSPLGLNCNLGQTSITLGPSSSTSLTCNLLSSNPITVTVTGTSGPLSHSIAVTFRDPPEFNVTASPVAVSVSDGTAGSSTITVNGIGGFNGTVALSDTFPSNLSCTLTQTSIALSNTAPSGTSILSCSSNIGGTFTVTVTGTNGTLSHTASVSFTFLDFTVGATSPSAVNAGQTASSTITVAGTGFTGTVSLSATAIPTGLTCPAISPASVSGSGTATLSCTSNTAGPFTVTITGTSGSLSHTTTATFNFVDFTIGATSPSSSVGSPAVSTITISSVNGFAGIVSLTNSSPPSGLVCQPISQTTITGSGTATLSCTSTNQSAYSVTITGVSGALSHSATATFTFGPAPDFTISASSPAALNTGQTATSTITIGAVNTFTGTVSLTDTTTSGLTCQAINPASVAGSGSATISCTAAIANTYTLTVTGTSGPLTHSVTATFNFQDFSITASSPAAINTGQSAMSTITVTALNGFTGTVQLTDTVPSGLTCSPISSSSVAGSGTATVSCSSTTLGTFSLLITGASGSLTHQNSASFNFVQPQDFTISATSPAAVNTGQTATSTITITWLNGGTGTVGLTDTVPSGLSCATISPSSVTGSGTASLNCSSPNPGSFTVTITGASGSLSHATTATFIFSAPQDFTITATTPAPVDAGSPGTSTITVAALNGFTGTVTLSQNGGTACSLSSGSIKLTTTTTSGTATLTCLYPAAGNNSVTVTGTSSSLSHSAVAVFQMVDFALSANPTSVTSNGGTASSTISVTALNGFTGSVALSSNNPACILSPTSVTASGSSILSCAFSPPLVTTAVTVTGKSGSLTHTAAVTFTPQDFTISANPLTVNASPTGSSTITIAAVNGFSGTVSLAQSASTSCTLNPAIITGPGTSTLTCTFQTSASVTVTGTSGSLSHSVAVTFTAQSFSISANPLTATINSGSVALFNLTLVGTTGFSGTVTLSATISPTGPTTSFSPPSVTLSGTTAAASQLSVITYSTTPQGAYTVTVTGTSGSLSKTATVTVNVGSAFSVAVLAPPQRINVGSFATPSISVTSTGFSGSVSLTASVSPSGPLVSVSPTPVSLTPGSTATSTLTISVPLTSAAGNYTFTVTGTSGSVSHDVIFIVALSDFSIAASPVTPSIFPAGASGTSTITLTSLGGFPGTVTLTYAVSPAVAGGPTASFVPSSQVLSAGRSSTSIMTISTSTLTPPGKYNITVTGVSNLLSHQVLLSFSLSSFTISVTPSSIPILPGNSGSSTITVTSVFGFSGNVSLTATINSVGSTPSPSFVVLTPGSVAKSTLQLFTSRSLTAGTYDGSVKGTITLTNGATLSLSVTVTIVVSDFTVSAGTPSPSSVPPGSSSTATVTVTGLNGFTGGIALTAIPSSSLVTTTLTPAKISLSSTTSSGASTLKVSVASTAAQGQYSIVVTGVNGTLSRSVTITVIVGALPGFTIAATPSSATVLAASTTTSTITVSSVNNFTGIVSLSAVVSPSGPTLSLNPTGVTLTANGVLASTLTFRALTHGTYSVTVNATATSPSGPIAHTVILTITVMDFSISPDTPSFKVDSGAPGSFSVILASQDGFSGNVTLTETVSPAIGLAVTCIPSIVTIFANGASPSTCTTSSSTHGSYVVTVRGSISSVVHTASVIVNVVDFSVSASPLSLPIAAGSAGLSTITLTSLSGFDNVVTLTASITPILADGPGTTLSPSSLQLLPSGTALSGLTISTRSITPLGLYNVTVTGTSGSLVRLVTVTVNVTASPDLNITANPASLEINSGASSTSSITVTSLNGFSGTVSLTLTVSPAGATASLGLSAVTVSSTSSGLSTLTVQSSIPGNYGVTITGTSGALAHSITVTLKVVDFTISTGHPSITAFAGVPATSDVSLSSTNGFSGTVALTASSTAGLSSSLSASSIVLAAGGTGSAIVTVTALLHGTYTVNVTGTSGSLSHFVLITVIVVDFTIVATPSMSILAGSSATSTVILNGLNGFTGTISLSVTGSTGLSALTSPNSIVLTTTTISTTSTLTVSVSSTTVAGTYSVNVIGTSGLLSHSASISVIVGAAPDFRITASPTTLTFPSGSSATSAITITSLNGFSGNVTLSPSVSGGPGANISPASVSLSSGGSATASLTVFTQTSVSPGLYTVTVTGTGNGISGPLSRSAPVSVSLTGFTIAASPTSLNIQAGSSATSAITFTGLNGFSGNINLTAVGSRSGLNSTLVPASVSLSSTPSAVSTLTISVASTVTQGIYSVTVTGSVGPLSRTATISLTIGAAQDFSVLATPTSQPVLRGSATSVAITLSSLNGLTGAVSLSSTVSSPGLVLSFSPTTVTLASGGSATATLNVLTSQTTALGGYTITVTGTAPGGLSHTVDVSVTVGDFSIYTSQASLTIQSSASGSSTITLVSQSGFAGTVHLAVSILPLGPLASLSSTTVALASGGSGSSVLTVTSGTAAPGSYDAMVMGTSGSVSHNVNVTISIVDFSIAANPSSVVFAAGSSATPSIVFTSLGGFSGNINLISSASSSNLIVSCNPTSLFLPTGSTGLSSCKLSSPIASTYNATFTGTNGVLLHSVLVLITVTIAPDFSISSSQVSLTVQSGSSNSSTITLTSINGFSGTVALSATVSTPGLTPSLSPSITIPQGGSATATLMVTSTIPTTFTVVITATLGTLSHSVQVPVRVVDFGISSSSTTLTVLQGSQVSTDITLSSIDDYSGTISVSSSSSPTGLVESLSQGSVLVAAGSSGKSTLTVSSTSAQTYSVTVAGTSGPLSHSLTITVNVVDFNINASPNSITIAAGSSGTATISLRSLNGFSNTVTLSASASPAGIGETASPNSVPLSFGGTSTSTLTITVPLSAAQGAYVVTVVGVTGVLSHSTVLSITVSAVPDFTLSLNQPSLTVQAGSSNSTILSLASVNGFNGAVTLSVNNPAASLNPTSVALSPGGTGASTLTVTSSVAGLFTVTITGTVSGTSGSSSHSVIMSVNVVDFRINGPSSIQAQAGIQSSTQITLASISGFAGTINLSASSSAGLSATLSNNAIGVSANQQVSTSLTVSAASAGSYSVTLTSTSGSLAHSITIDVSAVDFTLSASPASVTVQVGSSSTSTITVSSVNGFCCSVSLTAAASSTGIGASFSVTPVAMQGGTATSMLTVSASTSTQPGSYTITVTGTGGGAPHTIAISLSVTDFAISAAQQSITADSGVPSNITISVSGVNGFSGTLTFGATVSTAGLTASLNPSSVVISRGNSGASILTVTSLVSASFTVTVTATSGTTTRSTQVFVRVVDFSISGSSSLTVLEGSTPVSTVITFGSVDGLSGIVIVSNTASPLGLTTGLSQTNVAVPASGSAQTILTVSSTLPQTYTMTIVGTSGPLSHSMIITVNVVDFSINVSPNSLTVPASSSSTTTLTVGSVNGFSNTVFLSYSSAPVGPGIVLSPSTVLVSAGGSGISTVTVVVPSSTAPGPYVITLTGVSGGSSHLTTISLMVSLLPDFTISASPQSVTIQAGSSNNTILTLASVNSFKGVVTLTTTNTAASLSTATIALTSGGTGTSTLTVGSTIAGSFTVSVTGVSGSLSHSAIISVNVVDFRVDGPVSLKTQAGVQGIATLTATSLGGFAGTINLSVTPSAGLSATLTGTSLTLTSNQQVSAGITVSASTYGNYIVTVTGTSGSLTHSATVSVVVVDFSISANPTSVMVQEGSSVTTTITVSSLNGFCCSVGLTGTASYPGLSTSFSSNPLPLASSGVSTSILTLFASSSTPEGSYTLTVTGNGAGSLHPTTITVTVGSPLDFALVSGSQLLTVQAGFSNTTTLTLTSLNGFSGVIALTTTSPSASLNPTSVTLTSGGSGTSTLTVSSSVAGSFSVQVTSVSGSITHIIILSVSVIDFRITGPSSIKSQVGVQQSNDINVMSLGGFSGTVSLSLSPSQGLSAFLSQTSLALYPNQQVPTSLTVSSTVPGTYSVAVTGTSGKISRSAMITIVIQDYIMTSTPASVTIVAGSSTSVSIALTSNGFCCSVSLSASVSVPGVGVSASVSPTQVPLQVGTSANAIMIIAASSNAEGGTYNVTATGSTSGGFPHTVIVRVTVTTDFAISTDTSSMSFSAGGSGSSKITVTSSAGFAGSITLSAASSANGPSLSLSQQSVTLSPGQSQTVTLTISTNSTAQAGAYNITLTASSSSITHTASFVLGLGPAPQIFVPSTCAIQLPTTVSRAVPPQNSSCQALNVNSGQVLKFQVNATDSDTSKTLTLTVVTSSLPAGASFTPVSGAGGSISGVFNWIPTPSQASVDYVVTFTVTDGHGGSSTAQVAIHVNSVNKASSLPSLGIYWYAIFAALGAGVVIVGDRVSRQRKARLAAVVAAETN